MKNSITIHLICATRCSPEEFWTNTPLGISISRMKFDKRLNFLIHFNNNIGLPTLYNKSIHSANNNSFLVFIHDDVWVDDYFLVDRVIDGLNMFDIIGVAGSSVRRDFQPAWIFPDGSFTPDLEDNLSGAVAHGEGPFGQVNFFGTSPKNVLLLDGVFLALKKETALLSQVFFDEQFDFNFYDLDFCRTATNKGLKLGTWPIALTHQSSGVFGNQSWKDAYQMYLRKWGS
jgi:GT2 family glycosyltransferase